MPVNTSPLPPVAIPGFPVELKNTSPAGVAIAEWAPFNVRVNALAPGYVKTAMAPVDKPQFRRHWVEDVPMQRYAVPEELGPSLVYLASAASSFMTGSVLVVDGGYTLW